MELDAGLGDVGGTELRDYVSTKAKGFAQALLGCEVRFQWGPGVSQVPLTERRAMGARWLVGLTLNSCKMLSDSPGPKR